MCVFPTKNLLRLTCTEKNFDMPFVQEGGKDETSVIGKVVRADESV